MPGKIKIWRQGGLRCDTHHRSAKPLCPLERPQIRPPAIGAIGTVSEAIPTMKPNRIFPANGPSRPSTILGLRPDHRISFMEDFV